MTEKTKKRISMFGIVALLLSNFCYMADVVVIPAYAEIFANFSDASALVTNFIASGSQIVLIIGSLTAPLLMRHLSKKTIIVGGFGIFTVVATCTGLVNDATYVAVMRGITGYFMGLVMPTAMALIIELYRDDDKLRTKYIGWVDGSMAGIGAVMMVISGALLTFGWQTIFFEYLIGVPIWVMMLVCLPHTPPDKVRDSVERDDEMGGASAVGDTGADASGCGGNSAHGGGKGSGDGAGGNGKVFRKSTLAALFISFVACNLFYGAIMYEYSIYLAENFVIPSYLNGMLGAIKGVLGAVMGFFVFAPLFARAKRFTITICFCAQAIAYFGLMLVFDGTPGILWFLLCYSFIGIAFGLSVPFYYSYAAMKFPQRNMSLTTSLLSVAFAVGAFLSTYFVTLVQTLIGAETYTPVIPYIGACCAIAAVLTVIAGLRDHDRHTAFETLRKDKSSS